MAKIELLNKLWFVLFYIYNHDVTLTLYVNWTVFYINHLIVFTHSFKSVSFFHTYYSINEIIRLW